MLRTILSAIRAYAPFHSYFPSISSISFTQHGFVFLLNQIVSVLKPKYYNAIGNCDLKFLINFDAISNWDLSMFMWSWCERKPLTHTNWLTNTRIFLGCDVFVPSGAQTPALAIIKRSTRLELDSHRPNRHNHVALVNQSSRERKSAKSWVLRSCIETLESGHQRHQSGCNQQNALVSLLCTYIVANGLHGRDASAVRTTLLHWFHSQRYSRIEPSIQLVCALFLQIFNTL